MTITLPSPNAPVTVFSNEAPAQGEPAGQPGAATPNAGSPLPNNSLVVMPQYAAAGGIPAAVALSQGFISPNAQMTGIGAVPTPSLLAAMSTGAVSANGSINVAPNTIANPTNYSGA